MKEIWIKIKENWKEKTLIQKVWSIFSFIFISLWVNLAIKLGNFLNEKYKILKKERTK